MNRKEMALFYAQLLQFSQKVRHSREVIQWAFERCDRWYVAFSGGKDSTVVAALVREVEPNVPLMTSLPKWHLPETEEYLQRVGARLTASGSDHRTGWAPNWDSPDELPEGITWLGNAGQVKHYGLEGVCGVFLGLREEESGRRRVHLRTRGELFFSQKDGIWHCSPIASWTVMDVWAFIHSTGIDYNRAYDRMEEIGIPLEKQRIGPFAVEEALGRGQLAILKRGWPELFQRYAEEHPEARLYV